MCTLFILPVYLTQISSATIQGRIKWALIPAAVLLVMGLLLGAAAAPLLNYLWPVALILAGLYHVFRTLISH